MSLDFVHIKTNDLELPHNSLLSTMYFLTVGPSHAHCTSKHLIALVDNTCTVCSIFKSHKSISFSSWTEIYHLIDGLDF